MKNNIILLGALLSSTIVFSQVGINTQNPQGIFNIDGGKDNPATGSAHTTTQQLNDFTVTSAGNVGIGTIAPSQKLEIQTGGTSANPITGFKLVDGTEFENMVLTTDTYGVGTWKPVTLTTIMGVIPNGIGAGNYSFQTNAAWLSTHSYITLPTGTWRVDVTQLLRYNGSLQLAVSDYMWMRFTFGDSDIATNLTNDFVGTVKYISGNILGPTTSATKYGLAQGSVIIRNTTSSPKNYYLLTGSSTSSVSDPNKTIANVGGSEWGENIITAFPISQ